MIRDAMTHASKLTAAAAMLVATSALLGSCDLSEYCLNCDPVDAAAIDAATPDFDAPPDACMAADEECDGLDNDCDGNVDENPETLPGIGDTCGTNTGECTEGMTECQQGAITCVGASPPTIEMCDGLDNDCNGIPDDNTMESGQICGTNTGECLSGLTACESASIICQGSIEAVGELCDGLDNDCDGMSDEMVPPGNPCGPVEGDVGECQLGQEMCLGGTMQCVGAIFPTTEQCDALDHDCNMDPTNGFDLDNDPNNCGMCGHVCADDISAMEPHVQALQCSTGTCSIAACENGYYDLDGMFANGCEYACSFQGQEVCNLADDDCDGIMDEGIMPPNNFCSNLGACADPTQLTPICTAAGWYCDYENERPNVEVDGNGGIVPETFCDDYDNDCDGAIDEGDPQKGGDCNDGEQGICQATGIFACNADPAAPMDCIIDTPGQPMGTETCNNLDDDCDGVADEDPPMGDINEWVTLSSGVEIFTYEASRPDASAAAAGNINGAKPCSKAGVIPWTNVKYPAAKAACEALGGGARLCTEADWMFACEGPSLSSPIQQDPMSPNIAAVEAEWYDGYTQQGVNDWVFSGEEQGYARAGYMVAVPDIGTQNDEVEALTMSPRLDYQVNFAVTGTHYIWIRALSPNGSGNRLHFGFNGVVIEEDFGSFSTSNWEWEDGNGGQISFNVPTTGVHTLNIWMSEDGLQFDRMLVTTDSTYVPDGFGPQEFGCTWAYGSSCDTYQPNTCNGLDFDTDAGMAGDQNDVLATGAMAACYSDWGGGAHIHDLSGNVKEWTAARAAGVNPIRGGSSNNAGGGLSCQFDFTAADDNFFFPNVGFRCCR